MNWNKYVWLLVDAGSALTDQALDMFMLYEYAANDDWGFFYVGLGSIVIPALLLGLFGIVEGSGYAFHERMVQCTNFLPGVNLFANAVVLMRAFLGECFEGRGEDWVERWYRSYEDDYVFTRFIEAMLESGPQTILQAFVALRRPEGINVGVLYASMGFSILSVCKTLVATIVFGKDSTKSQLSYPEKVRMFLLSSSYELCEVVSRVFSVALLGYFCGGYFIAAFLAGEYALFFFILTARGGMTCCTGETTQNVVWALSWPLLLMATSLMCSKEVPFWMILLLRLLILGAYGAVSFVLKNDDAELTGIAEVFFWAAVVSITSWVLLMPAFVNSCHNLGISLHYTYFEPRSFTNKCYYPLEIRKDDDHDRGKCGCVYSKKAAEVADKASDIADMAAGNM